jgi:hypothetical protein
VWARHHRNSISAPSEILFQVSSALRTRSDRDAGFAINCCGGTGRQPQCRRRNLAGNCGWCGRRDPSPRSSARSRTRLSYSQIDCPPARSAPHWSAWTPDLLRGPSLQPLDRDQRRPIEQTTACREMNEPKKGLASLGLDNANRHPHENPARQGPV